MSIITESTDLKTVSISDNLDVAARVAQLRSYHENWQSEYVRLMARLRALDPTKPMDKQRSRQIMGVLRRLRLQLVREPLEISAPALAGGYEGLQQSINIQFVTMAKVDRLLWLHNFLFVMTPDLRGLADKIENVRRFISLGQQRNFLLGGHSGMGKSSYLNWYASHYMPSIEDERNYAPVIKVDAPVSNKSPKPLWQRIVLECGLTYTRDENEEELLDDVILYLTVCGVHGDVELTHLRQDNMTLLFQAVRTWRVLSSLVDAERRGRQAGSRGVKLTWRSLGQISLALTAVRSYS